MDQKVEEEAKEEEDSPVLTQYKLWLHAKAKALLKTTRWTELPGHRVNDAVSVEDTFQLL